MLTQLALWIGFLRGLRVCEDIHDPLNMTIPYRIACACLLALACPAFNGLRAQVPSNLIVEAPTTAPAGSPILITATLLNGEGINRVMLLYRPFGESEYSIREMDLRGNTARGVILPAVVRPPFVEYYLILETRTGSLETYPLDNVTDPFTIPPQKTMQIAIGSDRPSGPPVLFLSPDPNSRVPEDELVISISLLRVDSSINLKATKLLLDGVDITDVAIFSEDVITCVPSNLSRELTPGQHVVTVLLFDNEGTGAGNASLVFSTTPAEFNDQLGGDKLGANATAQIESRFERVGGIGTWYNRGGLSAEAEQGDWLFRTNLFVTSEESPAVQPQNRFYVGAESPWLKASFGDGFPVFPNLILSGKRVRGLHSTLILGAFNLDMTLGQTARGIEGQLLKVIGVDTLAIEQQRDPNAAYAPINSTTWGKYRYGTFERKLFAIRPSVGAPGVWHWGITWLSSGDDMSSIQYGARPQENVVLGTDVQVKIMNTVELFGQGAFSAFNSDISSGTFTDAYIDSVYPDAADEIKRTRDILDGFITVNDNLRPLSLKKLATIAYETGVNVDATANSFRAKYLYRGAEYNSFGQTFLRKDIKGFNIVDRLRLVDNQVFLTLGYERLNDNTSATKQATTTYSTINTAISYYPRGTLPSFTAGYSYFANDNDLPLSDPVVIDERTNKLFLQASYGFKYGANHLVNASYSASVRDDRSVQEIDIKNNTLGFGVTTQFDFPLQTRFDYTLNLNEVPYTFDYTSLSFYGRYGIVPDLIALSGSIAPTFGDFDRLLVTFGSEWVVMRAITLLFDFSYYRVESGPSDVIWSTRLRYGI